MEAIESPEPATPARNAEGSRPRRRPSPFHLRPPWPTAAVIAVCAGLAGLSLLAPYSLNADAWSWLVWGREVRQGALDTSAGSSWKPLTVLITTVLSLFGAAAPALWLMVVRTSWLLALVLAYRIASRLGGRVAGVIAALGLLAIPDPTAQWLNYVMQGGSEAVIAALVLGAIDRHLAGSRFAALVLGALAALGRPEAWPLLVAYGVVVWRADPRRRPLLVAIVALVPALWLVDALSGPQGPQVAGDRAASFADRARPGSTRRTPGLRSPVPLLRGAWLMVVSTFWVGAVVAVTTAARRARGARDETTVVTVALGAGVLMWIATLAAMVTVGFPGAARFMFAPAAVVSVLGGVGITRAVGWARRRSVRVAVAVLLAALTVALALPRVASLPSQVSRVNPEGQRSLVVALERSHAKARVARCKGNITVVNAIPTRAREIAWRLGLPLRLVRAMRKKKPVKIERGLVVRRIRGANSKRAMRKGDQAAGALAGSDAWRRVASSGRWSVYEVGCPRAR